MNSNPRKSIEKLVKGKALDKLLKKAGQIHGHYCPGLALGVIAASFAMNHLKTEADGLEDLIAVVETNNCFSDGVQFVCGCTFGNNALIFNDVGKTAFCLCQRNGKGIRISSKAGSREYARSAHPWFSEKYNQVVNEQNRSLKEINGFKKQGSKAAFAILTLDFNTLFKTESIQLSLPPYAPSHKSSICTVCKEEIMESRVATKSGQNYCLSCANESFMQLNGHGIQLVKSTT